jgi:hypothetical protein
MTKNTTPAILGRLINPDTGDLSPEAAESLLRLDFPEADHARMAELSSKAQDGALTAEEREELQEFVRVADLLAVLQSKARRSLRRPKQRGPSRRKGGKSSAPDLRRAREIERFQARLAGVISPEAIPEWLDTPNDAFDGLKPLEVIERGEIDRLWDMIFYLESGVAS